MGGKTQKVTETKALPPWVDSAYQNLFGRANNVSQQPYQRYGKPRVAPWSPMSTRGLKLVEGLPDVGRASLDYGENYLKNLTGPGGLIDRAGMSVSNKVPGLTNKYMNPWTSAVVDASLADSYRADAGAQNDLLGRAISSGANPFGGDRAGIAAASLAGEQARARNTMVAGLRHQGYDSARNAAIQALGLDRSGAATAAGLGLQGVQGFGDFSNARFNQASQAAKAHLEGGALQQQHNQNVIDADYQDFVEGRDWERNMVDWLSQIYGRGEYGGTTERTEPGPSPLNAILGLATAILPMMLDKGKGTAGTSTGAGWGVGNFSNGQRMVSPYIGNYATSPGGQFQYYADGGAVDAEKVDDIWTIPVPREGEILVPPRPASLRRDREVSPGIAPPVPRRRPPGRDGREAGADGRPGGSRPSGGLSGRFARIAEEPWRAGVMAGGLRMAASESPFPLQALGEGLSAGFSTALERRAAMDKEAAEAARFEREQGRLDSQFEQNLALQREQTTMQRELAQAELDAQSEILDDGATYRIFYPSTGKIIDTQIPIIRAPGAPQIETIYADDGSGAEQKVIVNPDRTTTPIGGIKPPTEGRKTENERQIDQLMARGFSRSDAEDIANGYVVVNTDPITGQVTLVNKTDGTQRPVDYQLKPDAAAAAPAPVAREGELTVPAPSPTGPLSGSAPGTVETDPTRQPIERTLWERAPNATGVANTINQVVTDVLPQVLPGEQGPSSVIRPDVVQDRQAFATATSDLIRALSINPRFPAAEMDRISKEINIAPSATVGTEGLRARMRAVDEMLRNTLKNQEEAAMDTSLPVNDRQAALSNANAIKNFLNILGVPPPDDPTMEELAPGIRRARTR